MSEMAAGCHQRASLTCAVEVRDQITPLVLLLANNRWSCALSAVNAGRCRERERPVYDRLDGLRRNRGRRWWPAVAAAADSDGHGATEIDSSWNTGPP